MLLAVAPLAVSHGMVWCVQLPGCITCMTRGLQESKGKLRGHLLVWELVRLRRTKQRSQTLCSFRKAAEPCC